jgi:uncharacterized protein involved in exopolysaccharide biosynthesis
MSYALVTATIAKYQEYLSETAASDSTQAESFWQDQLGAIERDRDDAEAALTAHLQSLPELSEGEEYPLELELETQRLQARLSSLEQKLDATQSNLDEARLTRVQQTSEAVRSLNVVDEPQVPTAPVSTLMKRITLIASYMLLGVVVAVAALLVTTVLDQSVSSSADLLMLPGISLVATVPPVRVAGAAIGRRSLRRDRHAKAPERRDASR